MSRLGEEETMPMSRLGEKETVQQGPATPGEVVSGSFVRDGTRFVGITV
jgi:hypothetical protein